MSKVLPAVLDDRTAARAKAVSGRNFVDVVHDGRASAGALPEFLGVRAIYESPDQERP